MKNKNIIMYIVIILMLSGVIALGMYAKEVNKKEDNQLKQNTNNQNINNNENKQNISNNENKQNTNNNESIQNIEKTNLTNAKPISGKIKLSDYCSNSVCDTVIGVYKHNNEEYKLKVNFSDKNAGKIIINDSVLDITNIDSLKSFSYEISGFEIYNEYFIVYANEPLSKKNDCYKGYEVMFYDLNLNYLSELSGYAEGDSFDIFKIENDVLYYQSLRRGNTVIAPDGKKYASSISNAKISLSDIINKNYNNSELINYDSTCYAEEIY